MSEFKRTLPELKKKAVLHWPDEIRHAACEISVLPLLLETQDAFISLLKIADKSPLAWKSAIEQSRTLTGPLFLKHLMVLTDIGGEALNKLPPLSNYFKDGKISFLWNESEYSYNFLVIHGKCTLANSLLKVDSKNILKGGILTNKMIDVAMLLLFASTSIDDTLPNEIKDRCVVGSLIGNPKDLDGFVKENYLKVSRQVGGATANAHGQLAQDYVVDHLKKALPHDWRISKDSTLPGVSHSVDGKETNFDVVATSPTGMQFGIEVSFQVTTNSVIQRKSREAESLMKSVHAAGHGICYVIDGAGNINIREKAVGILCEYSDCTVAMTPEEVLHLAKYLVLTAETGRK